MSGMRVRWEIDVDADTPLQAAQEAQAAQRRPDTTATVFEVVGDDGAPIATVDLLKAPGEQVTFAMPAPPVAGGEAGGTAAPAASGRLYVQWDNPFGKGPVVSVLRVDDATLELARKRAVGIKQAGMIEAAWSADDIPGHVAYFVEGFEDADSSYVEVFAATTGLPARLFEQLEAGYEEDAEAQGRWIEGADADIVLQRLESIKDMGYAERESWGAAEVFAADSLVVKAHGAALALYDHFDDNGRITCFAVDLPLAANVPTVDLDAGAAPGP